ncbi:hypothetical protein [Mesomycoplasma ovipneumoniae]|uniref:hypothetical protein n=1 Tax=Mesomycoplasma ovipneumoniae TaxID=29562 RepID=UPI00083E9065|nr:hypothetical protein [Mesomycoplasma ovipneumoniae]
MQGIIGISNIIELEVQNLSQEAKEDLYNLFKSNPNTKNELNQDWEKTKNYESLEKSLVDFLWKHPNEFIALQKGYKDSLYNQRIKKGGFEYLELEDCVRNLNKRQKNKLVNEIRSKVKYLKDENGNDFFKEPYIQETNVEFQKYLEQEVSGEEGKSFVEHIKNDKYVLVMPLSEEQKHLLFFKNKVNLILFALNNTTLARELHQTFWKKEEWLDPHFWVNDEIEHNYYMEKLLGDLKKPKKTKLKNIN